MDLVALLAERPIHLLPLEGYATTGWIREFVPLGHAIVCDFYLEGAELGTTIPGGYRIEDIDNVDHHAPDRRMYQLISSGTLAAEYIAHFGVPTLHSSVIIHHTDCDSIVSSGIVQGILPPDKIFLEAVIAADHTGVENDIADLLQPLQSERDLALSFAALARLLDGRPQGKRVAKLVDERKRDRERVERLRFQRRDGVAWCVVEDKFDTAFLPAVVPGASVIFISKRRGSRWEHKTRLGTGAPEGVSLHDLGLSAIDPNFGGRWNAGGNTRKRTSGSPFSSLPPEQYAKRIAENLRRLPRQ